jgi:hypothetical protein
MAFVRIPGEQRQTFVSIEDKYLALDVAGYTAIAGDLLLGSTRKPDAIYNEIMGDIPGCEPRKELLLCSVGMLACQL